MDQYGTSLDWHHDLTPVEEARLEHIGLAPQTLDEIHTHKGDARKKLKKTMREGKDETAREHTREMPPFKDEEGEPEDW